MISSFLAWFIIGMVAYLCGKSIHKAYRNETTGTSSLSSGYLQGYLAGVTNIKMYYYIFIGFYKGGPNFSQFQAS